MITPRSRPAILVTGFGPFPGAPVNPSTQLAEALARVASKRLPGYVVHAASLPTEWHEAPRRLGHLLDELDPVLAVHFGISHKARGFVLETRARNAAGLICDARGQHPPAPHVEADGPAEIAATLPVGLLLLRLRRLGLPVQASRDAGDYLCNALLYHSLSHQRRRGGASLRRGFVHLPDRLAASSRASPSSRRPSPPSVLDWDGAVAGGLEILATSVGETAASRAIG